MRVLTIRNIPDEVYGSLTMRAKTNRRSLQQEALLLLERVRALENHGEIERARAIRARLQGRKLGNTVAEVRRERAR